MNRYSSDQPEPTTLSPADAAALDALLDVDAARGDISPMRTQRLADLLAVLDRCPAQDPAGTLRAQLLARLDHLRSAANQPTTLCEADAHVLDALLASRSHNAQHGPLPPGSGPRALAAASLLNLLDRAPVPAPAAGLVGHTLQRVEQNRQREVLARLTHELRPATDAGWRIGLRQVGSVAAILVIGMSLLVPVLSQARNTAQQQDCRANLAKAGGGMAQYANDNQGRLPLGQTPDNVFSELMRFAEDADGQSLPSSAVHMLVLPRDGYLRDEQLTCPSGRPELVMGGLYSTQHVEGTRALRLDSAAGPLMADTNPLYTLQNGRAVRLPGLEAAASKNHNQRGQNVLMADTSIQWTIVPIVQHDDRDDNLWTADATPQRLDKPDGPASYDAFLTP